MPERNRFPVLPTALALYLIIAVAAYSQAPETTETSPSQTPTPEVQKRVDISPGDFLIELQEDTWITLSNDSKPKRISPQNAKLLQENGSIIPPWLSRDLTHRFSISSNYRQVTGGRMDLPPSNDVPVCTCDQRTCSFSWPPVVNGTGQYIAVIQQEGLRLCDFPPHHEGIAYRFPSEWQETRLLGFGVGTRENDLAIVSRPSYKDFSTIFWMKNALVSSFPPSVIDANHSATNPASEMKMRYLKGAIPRQPQDIISLEPVFASEKISRAMIIQRSP